MLVLSRKRDETIIIGDHIEITVVDVRGDKVRLGINAPAHIPVHRKEIYDVMKGKTGEDGHVESLAGRHHPPDAQKKPRHPDSGKEPGSKKPSGEKPVASSP